MTFRSKHALLVMSYFNIFRNSKMKRLYVVIFYGNTLFLLIWMQKILADFLRLKQNFSPR